MQQDVSPRDDRRRLLDEDPRTFSPRTPYFSCLRGFAVLLAIGAACACGYVYETHGLSGILGSPKLFAAFSGLGALSVLLGFLALCSIPGRRFAASELDRASVLSRCVFGWVHPTLSKANKLGSLTLGHLPLLAEADTPLVLYNRFMGSIPKGHQNRRTTASELMWALFVSSQRGLFWQCCCCGWVFLMAVFADPNLLHILLSSAPSKPGNKSATPTAAESSPPFVSVELLRNLGLAVMLSLSMLLRTTRTPRAPDPERRL